MAQADKQEAIEQMSRAVRSLKKAIDKLDDAFNSALASDQRKLFKVITALEERLEINRTFLRHLKAAEVVVKKPPAEAYDKLSAAITEMQKVEVETNGFTRLLSVAVALGKTIKTTRAEVSSRAT